MSAEVSILVATAVLAVVAIGAAVIAVRAARRVAAAASTTHSGPASTTQPEPAPTTSTVLATIAPTPPSRPDALVPHVVRGRVIVPPTQEQVVATALGRPGARLSILAHGVAHALRPESRDRIIATMRREYRRRRRERLQAGRRAARAASPTPASDQWLSS